MHRCPSRSSCGDVDRQTRQLACLIAPFQLPSLDESAIKSIYSLFPLFVYVRKIWTLHRLQFITRKGGIEGLTDADGRRGGLSQLALESMIHPSLPMYGVRLSRLLLPPALFNPSSFFLFSDAAAFGLTERSRGTEASVERDVYYETVILICAI